MTRFTRRDAIMTSAAALTGCRTAASADDVPGATGPAGRLPAGFRTQRPRLLTSPAELATLEARLAADEVGRRWRIALLRDATALLSVPPVELRFEPRRPVLLPTSREMLKRVETLGVAWLLTRDDRYAERIGVDLRQVCTFDSWNPAHFLDVAEMAMAVALAHDWCHAALSDADRRLARIALAEKALKPGLAEFRRRAFWTRATHNWALVCAGGLIAAAISIAEHEPELAASILESAIATARPAFASYGPDGGWDEGPSYWDYATQYAVFLVAALESGFGDDFGLARTPGFAEAGRFRLHMEGPSGKLFNFADGGESVRPTPALMWLARRFDRPLDAWIAGRADRPSGTGVLWFHPRRQTPESLGEPRLARFRRVEAASLLSAWSARDAWFVAMKAGDNAANHAHLDIGNFVFEAGGERFAIDLGGDDYSLPGYFSADRRFGYYRLGTAGQNTLLVDGANQPARAAATIVSTRDDDRFAHIVADLTPAYPLARRALRGVAMIERRALVLADDVDLPTGHRLRWQMHSRAAIRIDGARAELRQGAAILHARILEPSGAVFTVEAATQAPPQNRNDGISRLCIDLDSGDATRLRIAFSLDDGSREPPIAPALEPVAEWRR